MWKHQQWLRLENRIYWGSLFEHETQISVSWGQFYQFMEAQTADVCLSFSANFLFERASSVICNVSFYDSKMRMILPM